MSETNSKSLDWGTLKPGDYIRYSVTGYGEYLGIVTDIIVLLYITDLQVIQGRDTRDNPEWILDTNRSDFARFILLDISSNKDDFVEYLI